MGKFLDDDFENISKNMHDLRSSLRIGNLEETVLYLDRLEEDYDALRTAVDREIRLAKIESSIHTSPRSIDETLDHIASIIKKHFEFSRFDIVMVDHELRRVMRRYSKGGFGEADLEKLLRHGALNETRDYCLTHKDPWIVNDIKGQDPLWRLALELDVWVHGTFPLYTKKKGKDGQKELVGYLHGARNKKAFLSGKLFTHEEVEEIKQLGRAIMKAVKEAELSYFVQGVINIQDVVGSTRINTNALTENGDRVTSNTQMERVLDEIISTLNAQGGGIFVREENRIIPFAFKLRNRSINPDDITVSSRPLTGLMGRALFSGTSVIENEVLENAEKLDLEINSEKSPIHTLISMPLIYSYSIESSIHKKVLGAIVLINKKDTKGRLIKTNFEGNEGGFSTLDRQILEAISPHIETVISNSRSHLELQKLSITDGLTGLINHTHFMNNLMPIEFSRTDRYGTPLSLLLMDIDHFKVFNDIFGHQVGDLVLSETGRILTVNTRGSDYVCRYGGEEFAVLLHNTDMDHAQLYAEKIRKKIADSDYLTKIKEADLLDPYETKKRINAIRLMDDEKQKEAKMSVMKKHFGLEINKLWELFDEGRDEEALKLIFDAFRVTISVGLAYCPFPGVKSSSDVLTTADMLLLKAKENGRNRIEKVEV